MYEEGVGGALELISCGWGQQAELDLGIVEGGDAHGLEREGDARSRI